MKRINAEGRLDARLVLIGEAGGETEERLGKPFVGASGFKLNTWWQQVGLQRSDFYIDNVYPFHPPRNDLSTVENLDEWATDLHERLDQLIDPYVIVPTGNVALRAIMRQWPLYLPPGAEGRKDAMTIQKYRGSIMRYVTNSGREVKCIPTVHPAAIYHQRAKKARGQEKSNPGRTEKHCVLDWRRIAAEATFPEVNAPTETYYIVDELADLDYWRDYITNEVTADVPITIDIENPFRRDQTVCVGFAWSPEFAISVPLNWPGLEAPHPTWQARRDFIAWLCGLPNPKVFQNGACNFDVFCLARADGITVANAIYDLKYMHHCLDPVDDHDLAYMKSIMLRGEYHKDEAKGEKGKKYATGYEAELTYNGMDCCTQIGLFYALRDRLIEAGRWPLYETIYAKLVPIFARMMLDGINTSRGERRLANARLVADCIDIQDQLAAVAGYNLHTKLDLSHTKIKKFLYETLKLPPVRERGKRGQPGKVTSKEIALRKLQLRYPQQCGDAVRLILDHRRKAKLAQFLTDAKTDDDGRLRCVYEPVTEAGRPSSSKNPFGTGTNLFNQDRDPQVRSSFIPNQPDHVILELDCSQAESRIVYTLSGDDDLYRMAQLGPDVFDQHSYNAHCVFRSRPNKDDTYTYKVTAPDLATTLGYVSYDQRYLGKRTQHGFQRGMGPDKLADLLLMDDVIETPDQCALYLKRIADAQPGTERYFEWIRAQVLRNGGLTNSWGFRWGVEWEKKDADLYRRAYSFLPQSEVAFLVYEGLIAVAAFIDQWYTPADAAIILTVYDSIVLSVVNNPAIICSIATVMHETITRSRVYETRSGPRELAMFVEYKIGPNWGFPKERSAEWKRLPTREEVAAALATKVRLAA